MFIYGAFFKPWQWLEAANQATEYVAIWHRLRIFYVPRSSLTAETSATAVFLGILGILNPCPFRTMENSSIYIYIYIEERVFYPAKI